MREGAGALESWIKAYQRTDQAVVCLEDKAVLCQINEDPMLL